MLRHSRYIAVIVVTLITPMMIGSARADEAETFFESKVRPLLVEKCFECHAEKKQQGGLRLDSRAALLRGVDEVPAIVPGKPDESRLLQVVAYDELDTQMPPDGKLTNEQIAILTRWIKDGAIFPGDEQATGGLSNYPLTPDGEIDFVAAAQAHWAYRPIGHPQPPQVTQTDRVRTPIDQFILHRLEDKDLSYSVDTDRRTLLRRAKFDLLGLPPTFAEVQAFESDDQPGAYERLIDRLLASPAYGQRWGRHWLDVARYADTKGYSFTADPRYHFAYTYRDYVIDAFNADKPFDRFVLEQLAADRLGLPENAPELAALGYLTVGPWFLGNKHNIIDDRIDVVTRGLMGLTVACARCHDHKYDPIPTADYYSLYGVFDSSYEPTEDLPVIGKRPDTQAFRDYEAELHKRQQTVEDFRIKTHRDLLEQARQHVGDHLLAVVQLAKKVPEGTKIEFANGKPRENLTKLWAHTIADRVKRNDPVFLPWQALAALPTESFEKSARELIEKFAAENDKPPINVRVWSSLVDSPPKSMVEVAKLYARLLKEADQQWINLTNEGADKSPSALPDPAIEELRRVLTGPGSITAVPVDDRLFERDHRDQLTKLRKKVSQWHGESPGAPPRAMVLLDKEQPVSPVVFLRGTPGRHGPNVPRRFPRIVTGSLADSFDDGSGRLELARGIVAPDNPLAARVIVNRVWMHHFGQPLVTTPSDFGVRSDPPTHPALLDWLASSLIEHDWSLKWLHREIMTSTAYRQSSTHHVKPAKVDPENRLLWRMNRRRLEFEPMRDAMLAVADRLDKSIGGRSVDIVNQPENRRRSVYTHIDRNNFSPLLRTFDFPNPDVHSAGRPQTSVPQQPLYGMNAEFPQLIADALANHPHVDSADSPAARVNALYRLVFARNPDDEECGVAVEFLTSTPNTQQLAQALLMSNEFLFVD